MKEGIGRDVGRDGTSANRTKGLGREVWDKCKPNKGWGEKIKSEKCGCLPLAAHARIMSHCRRLAYLQVREAARRLALVDFIGAHIDEVDAAL